MTGQRITYDKHCKQEFGTYVQTHKKHNNSMEPRTSGAIALRPSGNEQGGHYFLSLHTGKRILRNNWTILPMPNDMVDAIHRLAEASKQARGITFMDRDGNILTDDDEDETEEAEEDEHIPVVDDIPMADENYNLITHNNNEEIINEQQENDTITGVHENEQSDNTNDNNTPEHDPEGTYDNTQTTPEEEKNESDEYMTIEDINITSEMNTSSRECENAEDGETEIRTNERYNLRPRPKNRVHFALAQSDEQSIVLPKTHAHIMMTQLNIKDGLKEFGNKGDETILKEIKQLHTRQALMPHSRNDMSYKERKKALRYLMFRKEKRDGTIKARGCADGRLQRIYTIKEDTSSPTMSIEAMMLLCTIDAKENRYVVVSNIPGAFLHADMEDNVHMLLEGTVAEMIVKLDPTIYRKHIWYNNHGKPMLYVQLKKALYRTLQAALLFWKLLSETLQEWGFVLNPYDKCVANKNIEGKQCTII